MIFWPELPDVDCGYKSHILGDILLHFHCLHVTIFKIPDNKQTTTKTSELATHKLEMACYPNVVANGMNVNKLPAVTFYFAEI